MTLQQARKFAQADADRHGIEIVVMHDPITNAEEYGHYGYCPLGSEHYVYRRGAMVELMHPRKGRP